MTPPARIIFVDVDDTLVRSFGSKRVPMASTIALVHGLKAAGAELHCWSSGGAAYARKAADELGLTPRFTSFLPKPHLLVDDVDLAAWRLAQLHPAECRGLTAEEVLAKLAG